MSRYFVFIVVVERKLAIGSQTSLNIQSRSGTQNITCLDKMAASSVNIRKLQVVQSNDPDGPCQTFVFQGEDHTLGNALRYIIMKNPDVVFCGYTVPHPSENKIHLRIQTVGISAIDVLRKGLNDLYDLCDHVETTFQNSLNESSLNE